MRAPITVITFTCLRCYLSGYFPLYSLLPKVNGYTARQMTATTSPDSLSVPTATSTGHVVVAESPTQSSGGPVSPVVHVYPFGTSPSQLNNYSHTKILHIIRHAEGTHNVNQQYRDIANLDARITSKGMDQCRALDARIQQASSSEDPLFHLAKSCDLVITSPLSRCIQTTLTALQHVIGGRTGGDEGDDNGHVLEGRERKRRPLVLAHEMIRETVNYNCDRRRSIKEIATDFPQVDYSLIETDHDAIWESYVGRLGDDNKYLYHRESAELYKVAERARSFLLWLKERPEQHIVCCSHAAFLRCWWNFGLSGDVPMKPPQHLDDRANILGGKDNVTDYAVVQYFDNTNDQQFVHSMRSDFLNCELRSMIIAYP